MARDAFHEVTVATPARLEIATGTLSVAKDGAERVRVGGEAALIGRHGSCALVLDDGRVSSVHAEIVGTERGARLRDLGSKNGTFVGGVRVGEVFLTHRTSFRVAETELVFEPARGGREPLEEAARFGPLVGSDPAMRALFARLRKIAATELTVLVGGETGTGKELVARAIHQESPRAKGPFVVVDCGSIPASLAEATLFGHEKGAFTGATERRSSPFVEADRGTIFLDELGELPVDLQPKLLRALAERRVKPVGGSTYRAVDVRVVAATRRDLVREVNEGSFRSDLFFRVAEVRVDLPPLRQRLPDIAVLVQQILTDLGAPEGAIGRVPPESLARLRRYDWPGNVRELKNAVSVAYALADDGPIDVWAHTGALATRAAIPAPRGSSLWDEPRRDPASDGSGRPGREYREAKALALATFERRYFEELYAACAGNVSEMARRAGMERAHVRTHLKRHGIGRAGTLAGGRSSEPPGSLALRRPDLRRRAGRP